jgi:hypothetical protein
MKPLASVGRWVLLLACAGAGACARPTAAHPDLGKLIPVRGRVTVAGKPVSLAQVMFMPTPEGDGRKHSPSGQTDPDGFYELSVFGNAGAPPGRYVVVITGGAAGGPAIAAEHRSPKTSRLIREVAPDAAPGAYDLDLSR